MRIGSRFLAFHDDLPGDACNDGFVVTFEHVQGPEGTEIAVVWDVTVTTDHDIETPGMSLELSIGYHPGSEQQPHRRQRLGPGIWPHQLHAHQRRQQQRPRRRQRYLQRPRHLRHRHHRRDTGTRSRPRLRPPSCGCGKPLWRPACASRW
jgi:hypothetical protein